MLKFFRKYREMYVYLILAVLLIAAYYPLRKLNGGKLIYFAITYILLCVIACFRDVSVGTDTRQYFETYEYFSTFHVKDINLNMVYEPGYMFYIICLSKISPNPRLLEIVTYMFINFSVLFFIYKNSKNYHISILIYVFSCQFLASMCMMRQFIAISIMLFGMSYLIRGKNWRFLLFVLIATLFHYFSLTFLLFFLFKKLKKMSFFTAVFAIALFIPLYIFLPNIIFAIISNVSNYSDYMVYLQDKNAMSGEFRFPPMIIILAVVLLPYLFNITNINKNPDITMFRGNDYSFFSVIYFFVALLIILAGRFALFTRFYYYYTPLMVLAPNLYCKKPNDSSWNLYYTIILSAAFVFCLFTGSGTYDTSNYLFAF